MKWKPKNIFNVLTRTLELGVARISRDDEELIEERCKNLGIQNYSLYLPTVLDNMYDFTQHNLYKLYLPVIIYQFFKVKISPYKFDNASFIYEIASFF